MGPLCSPLLFCSSLFCLSLSLSSSLYPPRLLSSIPLMSCYALLNSSLSTLAPVRSCSFFPLSNPVLPSPIHSYPVFSHTWSLQSSYSNTYVLSFDFLSSPLFSSPLHGSCSFFSFPPSQGLPSRLAACSFVVNLPHCYNIPLLLSSPVLPSLLFTPLLFASPLFIPFFLLSFLLPVSSQLSGGWLNCCQFAPL